MAFLRVCAFLAIATVTLASPTSKPAFWKGTALDNQVEEMRSLCANEDPIACLKYKAISFLDTIFQKDSFQVSHLPLSNESIKNLVFYS